MSESRGAARCAWWHPAPWAWGHGRTTHGGLWLGEWIYNMMGWSSQGQTVGCDWLLQKWSPLVNPLLAGHIQSQGLTTELALTSETRAHVMQAQPWKVLAQWTCPYLLIVECWCDGVSVGWWKTCRLVSPTVPADSEPVSKYMRETTKRSKWHMFCVKE